LENPFEIRKILTLLKRDFYNWSSYKSQIVTSILTALIGVITWGINANYVNRPVPIYNTDYVSFLITGILIANLILPLGTGVQKAINPWTVETVLMSGLKTSTFVLGTSLWTYLISVILFVPQAFMGVYFFGAKFHVNITSLFFSILISSVIIFSLAMITTGIRLVTKVTDPVTWILTTGQTLLAGMTFPVTQLDRYVNGLSTLSWLLPQTWVFHITRLSILDNASLLDGSVMLSFLIAFLYAVVLLPFSAYVFRWSMIRAKKEGTLGWY
jgi:ABC-2 type transport system permease protein